MRDTIDMAREAGIIHPEMVLNTLKAFEALVRADEREACVRGLNATDLSKLAAFPDVQRFVAELLAAHIAAIRARGNT